MSVPPVKKDFQKGKRSYYNRTLSTPQDTVTLQRWGLKWKWNKTLGEDIKTCVTNMKRRCNHVTHEEESMAEGSWYLDLNSF